VKRVLSLATLYPNVHRPRFGTFVAAQMAALAARGDWEVTVINPIGVPPVPMARYAPLAEAAVTGVEQGLTVHRPRFTLIPGIGGPFNPAMIVRAVLRLARRLHALAPFDLVDAQFFYPDGPAAARIAKALDLPLSIKARGADISLWAGKPYARRKMLRAARQAAGLLAVSQALAGDMAERGFPRSKITVHYTGLDRDRFYPRDRRQSRERISALGVAVAASTPLLVTVGALIPRKGQQHVLRALARLPGAHLALVGEGPDRAMLEAFARDTGMADRVHFLGSLDHEALPTLLSAADAMVLPSASEGLANAWVEALACGCPLVITDAGGAREVLDRPEAGIIVERDGAAIAAGVKALLAVPPQRDAVARSAERFSWQENAAVLAEYYEGITESRAAPSPNPLP
jgi:glycosyltransferase involved in cell wall biosynthesis